MMRVIASGLIRIRIFKKTRSNYKNAKLDVKLTGLKKKVQKIRHKEYKIKILNEKLIEWFQLNGEKKRRKLQKWEDFILTIIN